MLTVVKSNHVSGTHIEFTRLGTSASGKTEVWDVSSNHGGSLGAIRWFGRWRKYAFYPEPNTIFEEVCMGDMIDFLGRLKRGELR